MASSIAQPFLYAMNIIDKKWGCPLYDNTIINNS